MMRIIMMVVGSTIIVGIGWGIYNLSRERTAIEKDVVKFKEMNIRLREENALLLSQIEYYTHPENLVKQLKSQFNYHESDEKLLIIVPRVASTTTSTSQ